MITHIERALREMGYEVEFYGVYEGLTQDRSDSMDYVISEDWKSTGTLYEFPEGGDVFLQPVDGSFQDFWLLLLETAEEINAEDEILQPLAEQMVQENRLKKAEPELPLLSKWKIDLAKFSQNEVDILLFIQTHGRIQSLAKYLAKGALTGAATGLSTGIWVIPPGSFAISKMVAYHPSDGIRWNASAGSEGKRSAITSVEGALKRYPDKEGLSAFDRERQERRKKRPRKIKKSRGSNE